MPCDFPEHHSSGGGWGGPIAAIFAAMVAAAVLGPMLHWLLIALACLGVGGAVTLALVARQRWQQYQAMRQMMQAGYTPYLQPQQPPQFPGQRPAHQVPAQPPPAAVQDGGQHLHFHGMMPAEIAEAMRQLRGGR
jgi:hypothetical protein